MRLLQILYLIKDCPATYNWNKTVHRPFETFENTTNYKYGKVRRATFQELTKNPLSVEEFTEMAEDTQIHNRAQKNIFLQVHSNADKYSNKSIIYYTFTSLYYNVTINMPIYSMQTLVVNTTKTRNWEYHCTIHMQGSNVTGMHETQKIPRGLSDIANLYIVEGLHLILFKRAFAPKFFAEAFKSAWINIHPEFKVPLRRPISNITVSIPKNNQTENANKPNLTQNSMVNITVNPVSSSPNPQPPATAPQAPTTPAPESINQTSFVTA